jgi:hypothetical protein
VALVAAAEDMAILPTPLPCPVLLYPTPHTQIRVFSPPTNQTGDNLTKLQTFQKGGGCSASQSPLEGAGELLSCPEWAFEGAERCAGE